MSYLPTVMANTYTRYDLLARLAIVGRLIERRNYSAEELGSWRDLLRSSVEQSEEHRTHLQAIEQWGEEFLNGLAAGDVYRQIEELEQEAGQCPSIKIFVPRLLSPEAKTEVGEWLRSEVDSRLFLDIRLTGRILVGCALGWQSRYYDFSLSRLLADKRPEIVSLVSGL